MKLRKIASKNIRALRVASDLKQSEIAKKLGVTESTYQKWEAGEMFPREKSLEKLMRIFKCSIHVILGE